MIGAKVYGQSSSLPCHVRRYIGSLHPFLTVILIPCHQALPPPSDHCLGRTTERQNSRIRAVINNRTRPCRNGKIEICALSPLLILFLFFCVIIAIVINFSV